VKPWVELYRAHQEMRNRAGREVTSDIRKRLAMLAELGLCDGTLPSRFTYDKSSPAGLRLWRITGHGEGGEPLGGLPNLQEARLTVLLLTGIKRHELHELTIMLEGRTLQGAPWCVALHLPDDRLSPTRCDGDRQGSGACGHAALHCHVGPTLDDEPKVRVPLPPLLPAEALDWVLSQVVPDYEPAPWPDVVATLPAPRS
jgi:hypothetical protein